MTAISPEALEALLARAATVGFTPEGIAEQFGGTIDDLPSLRQSHVDEIDRMIASVNRKKAAATTALRDRTADRVADLAGLPAARNDGHCHYCGLPLNRRGYCEECI